MEVIAAVGGGAFVLVSLVLGVRLLMMAAGTRQLPEFACGLALLLMGAVGYPLLAAVRQATGLSVELRSGLLVAQMSCHVAANAAFCVFTARVFRPGTPWARAVTAAVVVAVVGAMAAQMISPGLAAFVESGRGIWRFHAAIALGPLLWAAAESARYAARLCRRLKLGLVDAVIVERFRLWALGMLLAASVTAVSLALEIQGQAMVDAPVGGMAIGVLGCLSAAAIAFAFMPPAAYTRWVSARSGF